MGCLFCESNKLDIVESNESAFSIRDNYPVTPLHTLIIPFRHVESYFELNKEELDSCNDLLESQKQFFDQSDGEITGYNIGVNIGSDAGQTVNHCHIHLIPRRNGDMDDPRGGVRGVIPDKQKWNKEHLVVSDGSEVRIDFSFLRDELNSYQKGKCFYCLKTISIKSGDENLSVVDHFFPHRLKDHGFKNLDGTWNLVLACTDCNRGVDGKFTSVPKIKYLQRLNKRNNYLVSSHHPLRESLIRQTGKNVRDREDFLNRMDKDSITVLVNRWEPKEELDLEF
jgi:diadenosine tetraphosphate (Ap4A) HIT family hydrolase